MSVKGEEGSLDCPICLESFNLVENVPHVLWCGHSLCKTCLLSLQPAEIKFPILSIQLPILLSCPWCQLLCFKLVWKGDLRYPRKNFFLLWLVESAMGYRTTSCPSSSSKDHKFLQLPSTELVSQGCRLSPSLENLHEHPQDILDTATQRMNHLQGRWEVSSSLRRSLSSLLQLTVKFPFVIIVMLFLSYVIMGSLVVLAFYLLITFIFAVPSLWLLCFFHPMLERLARDAIP